jgi:hypothetical protein
MGGLPVGLSSVLALPLSPTVNGVDFRRPEAGRRPPRGSLSQAVSSAAATTSSTTARTSSSVVRWLTMQTRGPTAPRMLAFDSHTRPRRFTRRRISSLRSFNASVPAPVQRKQAALSSIGASSSSDGSASIRSASKAACLRFSPIAARNAPSPWYRSESQTFSARNLRESSSVSSKKAKPSIGSSLSVLTYSAVNEKAARAASAWR